MTLFNLDGKRALVTGASGGIGAAIATQLHAQGAVVTLHGRNEEKLKALQSTLGERSFIATANLGEDGAEADLIAKTNDLMGGIDILVNNAGITRDNLSLRLKDDDWDSVLNVNLASVFKLSRGVMKGMMKSRWGRIIGITSIVGVTGNPGQANYAASKAGMIGMSKSIAAEVASRNITVNCIAPGFIATAMTDALDDGQKDKLNSGIPAGRMGTVDEIAAAVIYLASNESAYMTGQTLHVNGGMAMI